MEGEDNITEQKAVSAFSDFLRAQYPDAPTETAQLTSAAVDFPLLSDENGIILDSPNVVLENPGDDVVVDLPFNLGSVNLGAAPESPENQLITSAQDLMQLYSSDARIAGLERDLAFARESANRNQTLQNEQELRQSDFERFARANGMDEETIALSRRLDTSALERPSPVFLDARVSLAEKELELWTALLDKDPAELNQDDRERLLEAASYIYFQNRLSEDEMFRMVAMPSPEQLIALDAFNEDRAALRRSVEPMGLLQLAQGETRDSVEGQYALDIMSDARRRVGIDREQDIEENLVRAAFEIYKEYHPNEYSPADDMPPYTEEEGRALIENAWDTMQNFRRSGTEPEQYPDSVKGFDLAAVTYYAEVKDGRYYDDVLDDIREGRTQSFETIETAFKIEQLRASQAFLQQYEEEVYKQVEWDIRVLEGQIASLQEEIDAFVPTWGNETKAEEYEEDLYDLSRLKQRLAGKEADMVRWENIIHGDFVELARDSEAAKDVVREAANIYRSSNSYDHTPEQEIARENLDKAASALIDYAGENKSDSDQLRIMRAADRFTSTWERNVFNFFADVKNNPDEAALMVIQGAANGVVYTGGFVVMVLEEGSEVAVRGVTNTGVLVYNVALDPIGDAVTGYDAPKLNYVGQLYEFDVMGGTEKIANSAVVGNALRSNYYLNPMSPRSWGVYSGFSPAQTRIFDSERGIVAETEDRWGGQLTGNHKVLLFGGQAISEAATFVFTGGVIGYLRAPAIAAKRMNQIREGAKLIEAGQGARASGVLRAGFEARTVSRLDNIQVSRWQGFKDGALNMWTFARYGREGRQNGAITRLVAPVLAYGTLPLPLYFGWMDYNKKIEEHQQAGRPSEDGVTTSEEYRRINACEADDGEWIKDNNEEGQIIGRCSLDFNESGAAPVIVEREGLPGDFDKAVDPEQPETPDESTEQPKRLFTPENLLGKPG